MEPDYDALFSSMIIKEDWEGKVREVAQKIISKKALYEMAVQKINPAMPWHFIGIVHSMECGSDFNRHLHNGDPLKKRTVHVPVGRPLADPMNGKGLPYTWIESAIDAMQLMHFDTPQSWTIKEILYRLESYNGFGYEKYHNVYSPYLWSATNHYDKGKYDKDGHWNAKDSDLQVGAAPLLKSLIVIS
jgi:lysozyme family protein